MHHNIRATRLLLVAAFLSCAARYADSQGDLKFSDECLGKADALIDGTPSGQNILGSFGFDVKQLPGAPQVTRNGETRNVKGLFRRSIQGNHRIVIFPQSWVRPEPNGAAPSVTGADITGCSPAALAMLIAVMTHEALHAAGGCGRHIDGSSCAQISIDIGVAAVLCEIIGRLNECVRDPNCPPLRDSNGVPIPGLNSDDDICALAKALCDRHKEIADRNNTPDGKLEAATCFCDGWNNQNGSKCPDIPSPSGSPPCPPGSGGGYGDTPIVPPCQNCPPSECP